MSEWLKILISALAGMATATILEPLKYWIQRKISARQIKRIVYGQLIDCYYLLTVEADKQGLDQVMRRLNIEANDFYWESKRDLYYLLPNYLVVRGLFVGLDNIRSAYKHTPEKVTSLIENWTKMFELNMLSGVISRRIFEREFQRASTWKEKAAAEGVRYITKVGQKMTKKDSTQ